MTTIEQLIGSNKSRNLRYAAKSFSINSRTANQTNYRNKPNPKHIDIQKRKKKKEKNLASKRKKVLNKIENGLKSADLKKRSSTNATFDFLANKISQKNARSLGVEINNGRVLVNKEISKQILSYLQENNPIREVANIEVTKKRKGRLVQVEQAEVDILPEERDSDSIEETSISFDEVFLSPIEMDALAKITDKLQYMSETDIKQIVIEELGKAMVRIECYWHIHSPKNPGSLINRAVNFIAPSYSSSGYQNLIRVKNSIPVKMRKNAVWMMNRPAQTIFESMLDKNGRPILKEDPNSEFSFEMFNYPVRVNDHFDVPGDKTKPVLYFGDFSYFYIQDVIGSIEIQVLKEIFAGENKKGIKVYHLSDGQLIYGPFEIPVFRVELDQIGL